MKKRLFFVVLAICFMFGCVTTGIAEDKKIANPEQQALTLQVEKLKGTIDYANRYIEAYTEQAKPYFAIRNQAQADMKAIEDRLKALEVKK